MEKERGITLISLIIYVLLITFVVAGVSTITATFYSNVNDFDKNSESAVAYSKFNMYFLTDIKKYNAKVVSTGENYIVLSYVTGETQTTSGGLTVTGGKTNTVEYSVQNNAIYRNKVKICENVNSVVIDASNADNNIITIEMTIGDYIKSTTYKLENLQIETTEDITV